MESQGNEERGMRFFVTMAALVVIIWGSRAVDFFVHVQSSLWFLRNHC